MTLLKILVRIPLYLVRRIIMWVVVPKEAKDRIATDFRLFVRKATKQALSEGKNPEVVQDLHEYFDEKAMQSVRESIHIIGFWKTMRMGFNAIEEVKK